MLWLSVIMLIITMPLHAEKNYIFPAEVIGQAQYPNESAENYNILPKRHFSEHSPRFEQGVSYPQANQYLTNDEQRRYKREYPEKKLPQQLYNKSKLNRQYESDLHQFDSYKTDVYFDARPVRPAPAAQPYPVNRFNYEAAYPERSYPEGNYSVQSDYEPYRNSRLPAFENKRYQLKQIDYSKSSQKPVYASDIEPDKPSVNINSYQRFSRDSTSYPQWHNDPYQIQIQYVPVPVYNAPRTLPGTVPGVVVPGNMVPGYSHLTPDLSNSSGITKGAFSFPGALYNPFSGYDVFSGGPKMFDSLYNREYSEPPAKWPSTSPDTQEH